MLIMSLPPTQNVHDGAGSDDGSHERLIERYRAYLLYPASLNPPNGHLPSGIVRTVLENTPSWQRNWVLGNALYHEVTALEPIHSAEITRILQGRLTNDEILRM